MHVNIIFLTTGPPFAMLTGKLSQNTFKGLYDVWSYLFICLFVYLDCAVS